MEKQTPANAGDLILDVVPPHVLPFWSGKLGWRLASRTKGKPFLQIAFPYPPGLAAYAADQRSPASANRAERL